MSVALIYADGRDRWLPVTDTGKRRSLDCGAPQALVHVHAEPKPRWIAAERLVSEVATLSERRLSAKPRAVAERARRQRLHREDAEVRSCPGCGAMWCPVPSRMGRAPVYCSTECGSRHRRGHAGNLGVYRCSTCGKRGHTSPRCPGDDA